MLSFLPCFCTLFLPFAVLLSPHLVKSLMFLITCLHRLIIRLWPACFKVSGSQQVMEEVCGVCGGGSGLYGDTKKWTALTKEFLCIINNLPKW